jgi:lipopolysaccharide export system protein LptA
LKQLLTYRINIKHIAVLIAICLFVIVGAEEKAHTAIFLEQSETLSFDKKQNADCQVLRGNVVFRHDSAWMYCDSAYFYDQNNTMDAFGDIRMQQGDSLSVYGDFLHYDGNTRIAHLKGNVRMENRETILETDSFDYDRNQNKGYYYTGGKVYDSENELTSIWGEYSPNTKRAVFRDNVKLVNEKFGLGSNYLKYNTQTKVADIVGPSLIIYEEETTIYTEDGWYDTKNEKSQLLKNSYVEQNDGKKLMGDTIYYDKMIGEGTAYGHVQLLDTARKIILYSDYCYYREIDSYGLMYDSTYAAEYSNVNDTLFLHADTLLTYSDTTLVQVDSLVQKIDTANVLRGISNVRFYRSDLQCKFDTLIYSTRDSILSMYVSPVIWSDSMQLSGDFIQVYQNPNDTDMVWVQGAAMGITEDDSLYYNQVSGKSLKAFVTNKTLFKILVEGNAESIYHPHEEDGSLVGVNRSESSTLELYLKDGEVDRIVISPSAAGTLYPIDQMPEEKKKLANFIWYEEIRPKNKADIFTRYALTEKKKRGRIKRKANK